MSQASVYRAAPLDRLARIVTALTWAGGLLFVMLGAWLVADGNVVGWVLLAVGALVVALMVVTRRLQPLEYAVGDGAFVVRRRSAAPRRFTGDPTGVRPGALDISAGGGAGVYGYLGRFRADGRTVRVFATDHTKIALLEVGGTSLAVSPSDRGSFLAEVGRGA
jgi:hypothetical protein